jgi:hypothetical protein
MIDLETKAKPNSTPGLNEGGSRKEGEPEKTRHGGIFRHETDYDRECPPRLRRHARTDRLGAVRRAAAEPMIRYPDTKGCRRAE